MKMKRFSALLIALTMVLSIVPAIGISAAELDDASLLAYAKTTTALFDAMNPAPTAANDTEISAAWPESGWAGEVKNGYINVAGGTATPRIQSYLGASSNGSQAPNNVTLPGYGVGNDWVLLSFIAEYTAAWGDVALYDTDGKIITSFRYGTSDSNTFSVEWGHTGWGNPYSFTDRDYSFSPAATNTAITSGSTNVDVLMRNYDGYYTATYYVNNSLLTVATYRGENFNGFGSIGMSRGSGSTWDRISIQQPKVYSGDVPGHIVSVEASYTVDGTVVATLAKSYDSTVTDGVQFDAYAYSANGENVLYTAESVKLSASREIALSPVSNTGSYKTGDTVAHDGAQYTVKSDNLVPNGDFAYGLAGWYSCAGTMANSSNFSVENNALKILAGGGSDSESALYRAWDIEKGKTYFLTYTLDEAIEWARVTGDDAIPYSDTHILKDTNTSVAGKNNLVFTAEDEYIRVSFAWADGRVVSDFGLYEIEEADEILTEDIKTVSAISPVVAVSGYEPVLPSTVKIEGTLGSIIDAPITWDKPASYPLGEKVTVEGEAEVVFVKGADAIIVPVTVDVTVFAYDHIVETFWHGGDNSDSANFGMYNYLGSYNGGVIVAEAEFSASSGTNKLIMYGNNSTGSYDGAAALLRFFNTQSGSNYVFEYHDGGWKQSTVQCVYGTNYTLRTEIDITNKTYNLYISANGGDFVKLNSTPAAFRNRNAASIDRMIYTGAFTIASHKTTWTEGFSYLNVVFVDASGNELRDGYTVKAATGVKYDATDAPKLIEYGSELYILDNVDQTPSKVVEGDEDTLAITYTNVDMVEFESPYVNHVRGDAAINLPSQVKMVFSDGQKLLYPVVWDTTSVNTEALGEYEVTGTIDGVEMKATATVNVRDVEILPKTTENTVATNNGGWNWYVEPSGTHIQPGDELATRYESGQYSSNGGYVFKHDKTYMGWVEDEGTIVVGEYDHDNDTYKRVVIHEFLEADDHNNPAVVVLPDGRIMVFYSKHTTEDRMYYCVSKNPEDITEWNDWQYYHCYTAVENSTYNATYPSVFIVHDDAGIEGNDVIYVGWRGVHWKPTLAKFSIPDENGVVDVVMGQTQFANTTYNTGSYADGGRSDGGRRPYTKYDYDFDRSKIYITFTANHPDNDVNNNIYYVTFDIADQNLYTAKGNLLQPLPFENSSEYVYQGAKGTNGQWGIITNELVDDYPELLVFDSNEQISSGGERRGWTWDIKVNEAGEPCIVYVDVTATAPGPNGELPTWYGPSVNDSTRSHHYYWYARWDTNTQTWVKTFLTYGGKWWHENATQERCYSGGLTFDHNAADANVIYLSIPTMGEYGNIFEIYRWESDDHGATWTVREPITENSKINNVRPNAIYNYKVDEDGNHAGPRLLWKSGEYRYWMNYEYKTGVWTDFAADGFITQDDPEMFADAALYSDGEKLEQLPVGTATVTGQFNITNISIGDGKVYLALAHYNSEGALVKVTTLDAIIPARSVPQIGMVGAPKTADGGLSPMGTEEIIEEIEYTATFAEGDSVKLFAWNSGIEHPMSDITSVIYEISTTGNKFAFVDTFTYDGTEKLILDENPDTFNGWIGKAYGDGAAFGTHSYAAITKAPFGNTGLHLYHVGSGGATGSGAVMASHALPDTEGKDYQIKFSMRYIDEMSWNNTTNAGFTLSHGVPVYNNGDATPCAIQFRHASSWRHYNGRGTTGYLRRTRWFDGGGQDWIFDSGIYSEYNRGNAYDALMTGSNYEVTIDVSPSKKSISFSIFDGHRTVYHTESYVDANTYDWDNNPIDTLTFSVGNDKWGEIYIDDVTVEIMD